MHNYITKIFPRKRNKKIIHKMKKEPMEQEQAQLLLRMPAQLKADLQREADFQGRKLTQEINKRLRDSLTSHGPTLHGILAREEAKKSLPASYTQQPTAIVGTAKDNGPANALTDIDRAMLVVFHNLPPEKQLALLSLFR